MHRPNPIENSIAAAWLVAALAASAHAQSPVRWRGDFVYFADAAVFTDCASGQRWPVATSGDSLALERAYLQWRSAPQAPLLANIEGRLEIREPMEGPAREHIVVDKFISVQPGYTCESMAGRPPASADALPAR